MKNRKELKRLKRARIKNKKLLKKYPWLTPYNVWTKKLDPDYDYSYTWYDDFPAGWRKCFGDMMLEELDKASKGHISIEQIKEKYGELRFYAAGTREVQDIIGKYSIISQNVCINCGKPDVPMVYIGWQSPYCEKCFHKMKYYKDSNYEDYIDKEEDPHISDVYKYTTFSHEGNVTHEIDISDTVKKIRAKYHIV